MLTFFYKLFFGVLAIIFSAFWRSRLFLQPRVPAAVLVFLEDLLSAFIAAEFCFAHLLLVRRELVDVLNVLAGEMSVIGPRPISYEEMRWYTPEQQAELLSIPGGITGLWQSTSRNNSTFESGERQAIELEYIETASFKTDWRVFKGTFRAMLSGTGQ